MKEQATIENILKRQPALHEIPNPRGIVYKGCFSNSVAYLSCLLFK